MWTFALGDAPRLAQIHIDEDPGYGPEERAALRVRPLIENLWIGDEEDVSRRFSITLMPSLSEGHGREKDAMRCVLIPDLAIDSAHLRRGKYRSRAIIRLQSRWSLWSSVST